MPVAYWIWCHTLQTAAWYSIFNLLCHLLSVHFCWSHSDMASTFV